MSNPPLPSRFPTLARALRQYDFASAFPYAVIDGYQERMLHEPGKADQLRTELDTALKDPTTPWSALLVNESYEAGDELESEEAKQEILRLLWDAVYPELPPLRDFDIYRLYEVGEGNKARIALERLRDGKEVARIVRFTRVDERVVVEYELLDTGLMPATLRKLLRAEVPRFLAGSSLLQGVRSIECVDIQLGRGAVLPL